MRILILDSDRARSRRIADAHRGDEIVAAWDYAIATLLLRQAETPFDVVYLACVMGHSERWPKGHPRARAGRDLAVYIAGMAPERRPRRAVVLSGGPELVDHIRRELAAAAVPTLSA